MNEKIRKLAEQADAYAHLTGEGMMYQKTQDRYTEKFAELIIEECAQVCLSGENKENWRCTDSINKGFSDAVLDHFGVENDR